MKYRIATRGSQLALVQANYVRKRLMQAYPENEFEILVVKTKGDLVLDRPLDQIGEKGVFVKEIEEKILNGEADIGVHSMKDMPSILADGLVFAKAWKREDVRDVLILREKGSLEELPKGAVIGTGSKRRQVQLKRLREDLRVVGIRGNVDTRIRKMEEEKLDGLLLAAAGLHRLGKEDRITQYLDVEQMIPAPAQGVLALEIRKEDKRLLEMLDALSDMETVKTVEVEREFLLEMGGDCHVPIGAVCRREADGKYCLLAMFGNRSGGKQAYVEVRGDDTKGLAQKAAVQIRQQIAGRVYLVGGGPGDPKLITVGGVCAIRKADCIIYDRLSSPELLEEAKEGCEKIYVGKANHCHTMKQEEINRLLVEKSMEYETVVRLKGGDVYVFGRGGEEGIFLREKGVPFTVIPGVTSGIAGLSYAGIPITHRGVASGFHIVTAHDRRDELADIDFKAMAKGKETCVFLMGLSKVGEIAERLIEAGMSKEAKAAVISCATTVRQKTCVSDLEHIEEEVKRAELISPALIVVGDVVSFRDKLNFFEEYPLFGKRYLIPKIGESVTRLKELLSKQGAAVEEVQVGKIVKKSAEILEEEIKEVGWIIFTSKNGVEGFFESFYKSGLDIRKLAGCRIAVIGEKTAEVLRKYGFYADFIPNQYESDVFAKEFKELLTGEEKVWYVKAGNADGHLKEALKGCCRLEEVVIYENQAVELDLEKIGALEEYDGICFTCASSVERMFQGLGQKMGQCKRFYSIGGRTTACLEDYGVEKSKILQASQADYEGIVRSCMEGTQKAEFC